MDTAEFRRRYQANKKFNSGRRLAVAKSVSKSKRTKNARISTFLSLQAQGMEIKEIAEAMGIHKTTVHGYAREAKDFNCVNIVTLDEEA